MSFAAAVGSFEGVSVGMISLGVYVGASVGKVDGAEVGLGRGFAVDFTVVGIILDGVVVHSEDGLHVGTVLDGFAVGARAPIHTLIEQQIYVYK